MHQGQQWEVGGGNVPKWSSITPGKIHAGPKFQVIMLLDKHHEKQDFPPNFLDSRVEWWKISQSDAVDS